MGMLKKGRKPISALLLTIVLALGLSVNASEAFALVKSMGLYDRVIFEPDLGYRFDVEQTNNSGFSQGPQVGLMAGLGYENLYSAFEIQTGLLFGFSSISYPLYFGILAGGRPRQGSPYLFSVGLGEEAIYKARTQENASMPFYFKLKAQAQYLKPTGIAYGVSVAYGFFSEYFPGNTVSYTPVSAVFFMSFPLHSELVK